MSDPAHQTSDPADLDEGVDSLVQESREAAARDHPGESGRTSETGASKPSAGTPSAPGAVADVSMAAEDLDGPTPRTPPEENPSSERGGGAEPDASTLDDDAQSLVDDATRAAAAEPRGDEASHAGVAAPSKSPAPEDARPDASRPDPAETEGAKDEQGAAESDPRRAEAADASAAATGAPPEAVEEVEIENLDDALAEEADRLAEDESDDEVEGSFEPPSVVEQAAAPPIEEPAKETGEAPQDAAPPEPKGEPEPAPPIVEVGDAVASPQSASTPTNKPAPKSADKQESEDSDEPAAGRAAAVAALLTRSVDALARPFDRLSPKTRDTIGWIALNTAFLAVCVWLYVVLR